MNQPANVQLTCASCQQPYQIQSVYQASPHQCPMCGAMSSGQPVGMPQPASIPQPAAPGSFPAQSNEKTGKGSRVVFIIRSVVGTVALVVIIWTLFYILNRGYNVTVELGKPEFSTASTLNAGHFEVKPGKTFRAKLKVESGGAKVTFNLRSATAEGATISESGRFVWKIPNDISLGRQEFGIQMINADDNKQYKNVRISFEVF